MATKTTPAPAATPAPKQGSQDLPVKGQIKPDLLPADLGGGKIEFIKRGDYARTVANAFSLREKVDMKKDHVTQLLEGFDKAVDKKVELPTELPGENPEEFVKLFGIVREDYEAGQDEVVRLAQVAADKKAEDEKAAAEKLEKETALFAKIKESQPGLGDLASQFDCGNMDRFIAKDGTTDEQLLGALNTGLRMGEFTGWMIGDLVVELEKRGQLNVVQKLAEENGVAYSKVYNDCKTAKVFPPDKRSKGVSFTIYREVANAKFTDEQKKKGVPALVNEVSEGKHTTQSVREAVRKVQGKTEPEDVLPEDNEKKVFLVLDPTLDDESKWYQTTVGMPKELLTGAAVIIDPATKKKFMGFSKKPENRWVDLGVYVKPVAATEPAAGAAAPGDKKKPAKKK